LNGSSLHHLRSVATRLRCGGMFDDNFIAKYTTQSVGEKKFQNGSTFLRTKSYV